MKSSILLWIIRVNLILRWQVSETHFLILKKDFEQLRSDLSITKLVNTKLKEKVVSLERQTWSNSQYSRRECLELSGIPETIENKDLEGTVLGIFEKLDVMVDPSNIEDCHWIKPSKGAKKVIVKLSRRKDADKIRLLKKVWRVWTYHHSVLTQRSTSTTVYLPITKYCGVNVEDFYQTNIFTLFGWQMVQSN